MRRTAEAENLIRLYDDLESGRALEKCRNHHLTYADIGRVGGVSITSAFCYLNGRRRPRRKVALRLSRLFERLD